MNDSIISGNSASSRGGGVFCSNASGTAWFKINNCTISQNLAEKGSGIHCISSSTLTIFSCSIIGNSFGNYGGGMYCESSTPTITDSIISENSTNSGGDIYCKDASPTINNCKIIKNSSFFVGGGIYCRDASSPIINNSDVNENSSNDGGGIYCTYNSSPYITNCIINKNKASQEGGGIYCYSSSPSITNCTMIKNSSSYLGGGIFYSYSNPHTINSIFWENSPDEIYLYGPTGILTAVYSNIKGGYPGEGNINKDPLFVDSNADDFHLLYGSPCIDTGINEGMPTEDKDGVSRPQDGDSDGIAKCDMGAYEIRLPCEGDFDSDGDIDGSDLAVFAADFGRSDCQSGLPCEGDFDSDDDVDGSDLAVFAADFGRSDCLE